MSAVTLLAALAAMGATYDWPPVDVEDDPYGRSKHVAAAEAEHAPALMFETKMVPLRRLVAKPSFAEDGPVEHSVYQQTYPPTYQPTTPTNSEVYQGFQQYNTPEPRKSIGGEVMKGTEKLIDGTGRVLKDTGMAIEGTARNVRDGFRSVLTPNAGQPVAPAQPTEYQPYAYSQPVNSAPPYQTQPQTGQPPLDSTAAAPAPGMLPAATNPTQYNPTQYNSAQYGPTDSSRPPNPVVNNNWQAPADANPYSTTGGNPGALPPQGYSYPPGYASQPTTGYNDNSYRGYNDNADAHVNLVGPDSDRRGDRMVPLRNPDDDQSRSTNYSERNYSNNSPPPVQAPPTNDPYQAGDSFRDWNDAPRYEPPARGSNNYGNDPNRWDTPIEQPPGQSPPAGNAMNVVNYPPAGGSGDQTPGAPTTPDNSSTWFPLVLFAAIGSIAWNFYLGMNYIDARNKYRAALRRSGKAYSDAFDDV